MICNKCRHYFSGVCLHCYNYNLFEKKETIFNRIKKLINEIFTYTTKRQ